MNNAPNLNQASKALDPATEQLIHKVVQAFLKPAERGECRCHWIDPQKTPILVWKSSKDKDTLVMKFNQQKLIGLARSDKNGELYWKFREFYEEGLEVPTSPTTKPNPTRPKVDLPAAETPAVQTEESESVKEFRAKYGNPSSPTQ